MEWSSCENGSVVIGRHRWSEEKQAATIRAAAFDFDSTLVCCGKRFSNSIDDWHWFNRNVVSTIETLHAQGCHLAIFSNQAGVKFGKTTLSQVTKRFDHFVKQLNAPITVAFATGYDRFRKPNAGMWELVYKGASVSADSFFAGDAAGRPGDHSDDDREFARAVGVDFMTPEEVFAGDIVRNSTLEPV